MIIFFWHPAAPPSFQCYDPKILTKNLKKVGKKARKEPGGGGGGGEDEKQILLSVLVWTFQAGDGILFNV